jgi:hypothetical protein
VPGGGWGNVRERLCGKTRKDHTDKIGGHDKSKSLGPTHLPLQQLGLISLV